MASTAPVISGVGGPLTIQCNQPLVFSSPTATDNCDTAPSLTFVDTTAPGSCPQNKTVTRTWTAKDACNNSSTASQSITVQDTTPPVITYVPPGGASSTPWTNYVLSIGQTSGSGSVIPPSAELVDDEMIVRLKADY